MNDFCWFLKGQGPFNPDDVLRIMRFSRHNDETAKRSNGFVELSFNAVGGRAYSVETASDLAKKEKGFENLCGSG